MFSYDRNMMDLAALRKVAVTEPPRGQGKLWQGVQHGKLVDAVMDFGRDQHGLVYDRSKVAVYTTEDGGDAAVAVPVAGGREFDRLGMTPYLGLVMSNRQTEVLTAFCGAADGNGLRFVNARLSRNKDVRWNYTTHFDMEYVRAAVWKWWLRHLATVPDDRRRLEQADASPGRVNNILMAVGRKELLPWSRVGSADRAFRVAGGKSLLDLYRAVCVPLSLSNAIVQLKSGWRVNSLLLSCAAKKSKETV